MGNKATTIDQQIQKLRDRGVVINDEKKAKENLLDIGYFRLCSYLFPFEKTYPKLKNRNHEFKAGTQFEFYSNILTRSLFKNCGANF